MNTYSAIKKVTPGTLSGKPIFGQMRSIQYLASTKITSKKFMKPFEQIMKITTI